MAPERCPVKRKALSNKDVNQVSERKKRNIDIKPSKQIVKPRKHSKDISELDISGNSDELEARKLQSLQDETSISTQDIDNSRPLTKANLKILQGQLFRFEGMVSNCEHRICSNKNMNQVTISRNWFLFELELTRDGVHNFRNSCYHNKVYKKIDSAWKVKNCLEKKNRKHVVPFQIEHIHYTPIEDIMGLIQEGDNSKENSIDIDIYSIVEGHPEGNIRRKRVLPHSLLFKRNRTETFEDTPVLIEDLYGNKEEDMLSTSNEVSIYVGEAFSSRAAHLTGLRSYFKRR
ncbi:Mam1 protein [Maudiozyma humilis]|uniref:Mam1 protein n=1 Tax=Maudiozyma humilis TaxID=51915 RepID=A0AAV5RY59_MAUHU|nr:Mam1 protein [Kazachstania humilis]